MKLKTLLLTITLLALIACAPACATHTHERPVTNNQGELVGVEKTKWKYVAIDSKAASVNLEVSDLNYHRTVKASEPEVQSDEATVAELTDALGKAKDIAETLK